MIDMIYASKLYRTSKRKDKIHAAFSSTANSGLVTQLTSYLDPEYQKYAKESDDEPEPDTSAEGEGDSVPEEDAEMNYEIPDALSSGLDKDFNPSDHFYTVDDGEADDLFGPDEGAPETDAPDNAAPSEAPDADSVEESTSIYASVDIASEADMIKGTLNSREDTAGVSRVQLKDEEFWIYYNDDINLNNIMTDVIEFFNASGRTYLEFNRLARSDNAIVFVIHSVHENIKPMNSAAINK